MTTELATLAGGCFWCLEAVFKECRGVQRVESGYSGGHVANPTYAQVCGKKTGHAEVVQVTYDPAEVTYRELLEVFFTIHDPTTMNRQGNDSGPQYRSAIYVHSPAQEQDARAVMAELEAEGVFVAPLVTELAPFEKFWKAETAHDDYFARNPANPYCSAVVAPKVSKFRKTFLGNLAKV